MNTFEQEWREIHHGGGHVTHCNGAVHRITVWQPCSHGEMGGHLRQYVESRCFCADPEFLAKGFDFTLFDRFKVEQ